jgi:hypothetical protein
MASPQKPPRTGRLENDVERTVLAFLVCCQGSSHQTLIRSNDGKMVLINPEFEQDANWECLMNYPTVKTFLCVQTTPGAVASATTNMLNGCHMQNLAVERDSLTYEERRKEN